MSTTTESTIDETAEREAFEESVFAQYFLSTIHRNPNVPQPRISGALDFVSDAKSKAEFCRKDENGRYVEGGLEPAWWAWQERAKKDAALAASHAKLLAIAKQLKLCGPLAGLAEIEDSIEAAERLVS